MSYEIYSKNKDDDPLWDGTDFAHPAWWRGSDAGVDGVLDRLESALDDRDDGTGVLGYPRLEIARRRILRLNKIASCVPHLVAIIFGIGIFCVFLMAITR